MQKNLRQYFSIKAVNLFLLFNTVLFIVLLGLSNQATAQTVLWTEDFETIQPTNCSQTTGGLTSTTCIPTGWLTRNTYPLVATSQLTHNLSGRALKFMGVVSTGKTGWVMTHGTSLNAGTAYTLKFWYRTGGTVAGTYTINVGESTNQFTVPTVLTQLVNTSVNNNTYIELTYNFTPVTTATYYFGVRFVLANNAAGPRDLVIDDMSLSQNCTTPATPVVGTITQPACGTPTGSVDLSGLPATGTWTITRSPGGVTTTGTGTTTIITTLPANATYTFTVTDGVSGCTSAATGNVVINAAPAAVAPTGITGTNQVCSGNTTTLTATGGNASTQWFTGSCGGTQVGTGATYTTAAINGATTYYAANEVCGNISSCASLAVTITPAAVAPSGITGTSSVCLGGTTNLTATGGNASTKWYTSSCGGTQVGTGATYTTPALNNATTYYAANEVCGSISSCASLNVTITAAAVAPSAITGNSTICNNATTTLTATGGDASTKWYTASCGGTQVGTGATYTTPALNSATMYYAANEVCGSISSCASLSITITPAAVAPSAITGNASVCGNATTTLTATGGDASTKWFTVSCGGTQVGTGAIFTTPVLSSTTTYYAANEVCGSISSCASQTVTFTAAAAPPSAITGTSSVCQNTTTALTAVGGDANTKWYTASCGGTQVATGATYTTPALNNAVTYYAANESCGNITACDSMAITIIAGAVPPTAISGDSSVCTGTAAILTAVGGDANTKWFTGSCGATAVDTGATFTTPTVNNAITYYAANEGCAGLSACVAVSVAVNTLPAVSLSPFAPLCHFDLPITLSGGSPAGGIYLVDGTPATTFHAVSSGVGSYVVTYTYTDGNGCTAAAIDTIVVTLCTGIAENNDKAVQAYPNPATTQLFINLEAGNYKIVICDAIGKQVQMLDWETNTAAIKSINTSLLGNGIYFADLLNAATGGNKKIKFVVEH